jgi:hypothetical protein
MEIEGKIRRQRYFTLKHYRQLLEEQNLLDDRYDWIHMEDVGGYSYADATMFYNTQAELLEFIATVQENRVKKAGKVSGNRPAPKKRTYKNPIINGVVKRGRPRKDQNPVVPGEEGVVSSEPAKKKAKKRKADELELVTEDAVNLTEPALANGKVSKPAKPRKRKKGDQPLEALVPSKDVESMSTEAHPSATQAIPDPQGVAASTEDTVIESLIPTNRTKFSNTSAADAPEPNSTLPATQSPKARAISKKKKRPAEDVGAPMSVPPKKKQKLAVTKPLPVKELAITTDAILNGKLIITCAPSSLIEWP